jgi:PEP-CTERM motif
MTGMIRTLLVAGTALAGFGWAMPAALAESVTYSNNTEVAYYSGTSPNPQGGDYWDATAPVGIGEPTYYTPSVTVGMTNSGSGATETSTVTISFSTGFYGGSEKVGSYNVYGADIFIGSASSTPNSNYTYAIALGFDTAEGGATKGLYKLPTTSTSSAYETSQQVWGGRGSSYTYGGEYAQIGGNCGVTVKPTSCSGNLSPTVLLNSDVKSGGSSDIDSGVSAVGNSTHTGSADGTLTVTITGLTSLLAPIFDDFDIFWGTADCSNAPIWEDVDLATAVPEPSTLALLASALALAAAAVRRRRRAQPLALS